MNHLKKEKRKTKKNHRIAIEKVHQYGKTVQIFENVHGIKKS